MSLNADDYPRSMRDEGVQERRKAMLHQPHMQPLSTYVAKLRERRSGQVPDFDPFDGGTDARVLFLFEKPGRMTANGRGKRVGSGFISRNNNDPTAEATFDFMQRAGIPRKLTVTWNLIPWWNGTRRVTGEELQDGFNCLQELIAQLPKLRGVVLVGRHAAKAKHYLNERYPRLRVLTSDHPSPLVRAKFPKRWNAIPLLWAKVWETI
jgi:uracil-DNA glycosylase